MKKKKSTILSRRRLVITVTIIASLVLYIAGVFSGLYANNILQKQTEENLNVFEKKTQENILSIKTGTESDIESLRVYISFLEKNLQSTQLQQVFMETLDSKEQCRFSEIAMDKLFGELDYYWRVLPFRIEEYEKNNKLSDEYINLKRQYTQLSLQTWILARQMQFDCNAKIVNGLYFYSSDCETCTTQGENLDIFRKNINEQGYDVIMFPIDFDSEDRSIQSLKLYYGIETTPAIIINDVVFQGDVFNSKQLEKVIN